MRERIVRVLRSMGLLTYSPRPKQLSKIGGVDHVVPNEVGGVERWTRLVRSPTAEELRQIQRPDSTVSVEIGGLNRGLCFLRLFRVSRFRKHKSLGPEGFEPPTKRL